jgi:PleD family two-component response regulator
MLLIGGDITCESKFGGHDSLGKQISGWTKFSLLFPLIDKASNNLSKITSDIVVDDFKKILFIDEKDNFLLIQDKLEKNLSNLTFELAPNLKEASRMIKLTQYQLIIIDINISKINSIEFVRKIRSSKDDGLRRSLRVSAGLRNQA